MALGSGNDGYRDHVNSANDHSESGTDFGSLSHDGASV